MTWLMCLSVWGGGYHAADEIVNAFGVCACYLLRRAKERR
jgi:hypothetical protein